MGKEPPNPHIPEDAMIITGTTPLGETVKYARGFCECVGGPPYDRAEEFMLSPGERWVCTDCRRVYSFDGERIDVQEPVID